LLNSGYKPFDIIVGGNSTGGNLAAALLAHLRRPRSAAVDVRLAEPLAGAFAVSSWLTMGMASASFKESRKVDMLSPDIVHACGVESLCGNE
jgi:acetyl esterase/lipase